MEIVTALQDGTSSPYKYSPAAILECERLLKVHDESNFNMPTYTCTCILTLTECLLSQQEDTCILDENNVTMQEACVSTIIM